MESLAQVTTNALVLGFSYALLAIGFTLIFSIMGVVNIAHADLYMLGGFMVFYLFGMYHINYLLTLLAIAATLGVLGVVLERFLFRRLRGKGFAPLIILSLGLSLLIEGIALMVFGEREKGVDSPFTGVVTIGNVSFGLERLVILVICIGLFLALFYFLGRIKSGQAMRALAQDADAASLQGIDINRISMLAFAIAVGLAGIAGGLLIPLSFVSYKMGGHLIMKCFIVVVVGGLGSVPGCLIGGILLGFIESFSLSYLPTDLCYLIIFGLVYVVLLIRPRGIMGRAEIQ